MAWAPASAEVKVRKLLTIILGPEQFLESAAQANERQRVAVYSADGDEGTPHRRRRIYRGVAQAGGFPQEWGHAAVARCPLYRTGPPWSDSSPVEPVALALL